MDCPKCGAEVGLNSVLCPRCHERIPNRHLNEVATHALRQGDFKKQKSGDEDSDHKHHWVNVFMGLLVFCTAGFVCVKLGGDLVWNVKDVAMQTVAASKERMEEVCLQGFEKFSDINGANGGEVQQTLDEYAKQHGFPNAELFLAACSQFAGKLAKNIFQKF